MIKYELGNEVNSNQSNNYLSPHCRFQHKRNTSDKLTGAIAFLTFKSITGAFLGEIPTWLKVHRAPGLFQTTQLSKIVIL